MRSTSHVILNTLSYIILSILFSILSTLPAKAYQMQDSQFQLESDDLSIFSQEQQITPTPLNQKLAEKEKNTIIHTKSNKKASGFRFYLDRLFIDFGELEPTNPITRLTTMHIYNELMPRYSLLTWENYGPVEKNGVTIADTSCDNGACTEIVSASWETPLTYGFGYRCDNVLGNDCHQSFKTMNAFRRFANKSIEIKEQAVMSGGKTDARSQVTYKINVPPSQQQAGYRNTVTYLLVPGF